MLPIYGRNVINSPQLIITAKIWSYHNYIVKCRHKPWKFAGEIDILPKVALGKVVLNLKQSFCVINCNHLLRELHVLYNCNLNRSWSLLHENTTILAFKCNHFYLHFNATFIMRLGTKKCNLLYTVLQSLSCFIYIRV